MKHEHEWARYFSPIARWDGTYRYRCITCRYVESFKGTIPEIEAKLKQKNETLHPAMDMPHDQKIAFAYGCNPQREWVGLTHQERNAIRGKYWIAMSDDVFDDIEAKLKEKNT